MFLYDITQSDELNEEGFFDYTRLSTGIRRLDDILAGGLNRGELIILGARPAIGKTTFAVNLAINAAMQEQRVFFLSCEISPQALALKFALRMKTSIRGLSQYEWTEFIEIDVERSVDSVVRSVTNDTPPDLVIIDYIQFLATGLENRNYAVGDIGARLKRICNDNNIIVFALAQVSRQGSEHPTLVDLKDSGNLEQDADVVMFLNRNDRGLNLSVKKNRNGELGEVALNFIARESAIY